MRLPCQLRRFLYALRCLRCGLRFFAMGWRMWGHIHVEAEQHKRQTACLDDDYQIDTERPCPFCGNPAIHWQHCNVCEDGYINRYEEDPLWYDEDDASCCPECHGYGVQMWCPKCGKDPRCGYPPFAEQHKPYTDADAIEWRDWETLEIRDKMARAEGGA